MERQLQLAHISSPPIGSACRADDRGAWRSVFSLLIGAPSATRTRPCALGLRRSSSTTMAPAARASPLPKAFTYRGQRQPRAFCISRRRVFAPTHPWLAPIIPAKARRAMAATAAARAAAVAVFSLLNVVATQSLLHATCNLYCLSRGCTLARAIYLLGQISTRLSMLLASRRPCGRLDSDRGRRIESDAQPELRRVRRRRIEPS